jgi:hypothetical protein
MRLIVLLLFCTSCFSQGVKQETISLEARLLVGELKNNQIHVLIDKKAFIDEINKSLYGGKSVIDNLDVLTDYTVGDKKDKFYFLQLTSGIRPLTIVRWVENINGQLYLDQSGNPEGYTHLDFFITCEGGDKCSPRLFVTDGKYGWSCREFIGCVTPEEAEKNLCVQSATVF